MAGPWEKYAQQPASGGKPWERFSQPPAAEAPQENVIATTPDGGRVIKGQDGALSFTSPAFSTNDPAKVAEIMKGATAAETSTSGFDQATIANAPALARVSKFVQGYPFVGQYVDEAIGATFGDKAKDATRAIQGAMDREHPMQSTALQVAGGVTGGAGLAAGAGPTIVANAPGTLGSQVVAGGVAGATAGAVEGAVSGAGAANDGDRMKGAMKGGMIGGAFGAAVGAASPAVARGISSVAEYLKKTDIGIIAKTFNISPKAAEVLKADLGALDPASAQANLKTAGADAMVADAGISTREALDSAITGGGKAAQIGTEAVSARAAAAGGRLSKVMDAVLGVPEGVKSAAKTIASRTAQARQKLYDAAYSSAVNYADDSGRKIEEVLSRIPSTTLKTAISEANDAMKAAGLTNRQIMAEIAPDGAVVFKEMPNVQQLDEIKKALGVVGREVDQLGRPTAAANRANRLAGELKDAISGAVPVYGRAVKLGGDKIAEDNALLLGRKLFSTATTRETVQETMKGASIEAQDAARRGIRSYIDDALARVRRSIDDPSIDTTETQKLLTSMSSRDAREKLTIVLGKTKADRLFAELDTAGKQLATRQAIATGSATGRREARSRALDQALSPGVLGSAQRGELKMTAKALVQLITRETPQAELARRQQILSEVATALTQKRGQAAQDALVIVQKAISGQPIKSAEAARLGELIATSGALLGYQTGIQSLQTTGRAQ